MNDWRCRKKKRGEKKRWEEETIFEERVAENLAKMGEIYQSLDLRSTKKNKDKYEVYYR